MASSTNSAYSTLPSSSTHPVRFGDLSGGTPNQYGEILIFTKALSENDREKFEGYLAHKWGLNSISLTSTRILILHPRFIYSEKSQ